MKKFRVGDVVAHVVHGNGVIERLWENVSEGMAAGRFGPKLQSRIVKQQDIKLNPSAQEYLDSIRQKNTQRDKEEVERQKLFAERREEYQREQERREADWREREERKRALVAEQRAKYQREQERREADRREREERKRALVAEQRAKYQREQAQQESARREKEKRERELREKKQIILQEIRKHLTDNFFGAESYFRAKYSQVISEEEFEKEKIEFLKAWFSQHVPAGDAGKKFTPDDEQLAAIGAVNGHVQVVARAGSGKTATLVNRTFFLLKHCRVPSEEILMLAFNKKAALEIRRRLLSLLHKDAEAVVSTEIKRNNKKYRKDRRASYQIDNEIKAVDGVAKRLDVKLPHAMTFHALAHAIVHPEEEFVYDDNNGDDGELGKLVQDIIDDRLQDPAFVTKVRSVMLAHFRADWERIVDGGYDRDKEAFLAFRRFLPKKGLDGRSYKSYGEKTIADFLFEHDVEYKYEKNCGWVGGTSYRPDFTIEKVRLVIEYFGMEGDVDYDEMSEQKRNYWKSREDWTLIEFVPRDIKRDSTAGLESFHAHLKGCLEKQGVRCARLSEDEIWERARKRAVDQFTKAMTNFINRCRQRTWTLSDLRRGFGEYAPLEDSHAIEKKFLDLGCDLYGNYLERLSKDGKEDFNGLMQRAAERVREGQTLFKRKAGSGDLSVLRYICIDEFQDFSALFNNLIKVIRTWNPVFELFCVGDDWQAINGFAGSDLKFFKKFQRNKDSRTIPVSTNYRSYEAIVSAGNALMNGLGNPAITPGSTPSGKVFVSDITKFKPTTVEKKCYQYNGLELAVLRVVNRALERNLDVVMLCRNNYLPKGGNLGEFLFSIRGRFPKGKERITISTAHRYKGLEKSVVIVLDAVSRSYPLIHPNWVFFRIFGDNIKKIIEEERRLFYVALTRAVQELVIFTDEREKSPFLENIQRESSVTEIDWVEFPPVLRERSHVVVKISNSKGRGAQPTISIKELLKNAGYQYSKKVWVQAFPVGEFGINTLKSEAWVSRANGVDVHIYDETEKNLIAHYQVDGGNWHTVVDNLGEYL